LTQPLRVRLVIAATFGERDDVVADRGELASSLFQARDTPGLFREEIGACPLECVTTDTRRLWVGA
jgi:hypothetical protein